MGSKAIANAAIAAGGGVPKPGSGATIIQPVRPMLRRFSTAVTMLKSMTVASLATTISLRPAGLHKSVSNVPRSFSPAQRSMAG